MEELNIDNFIKEQESIKVNYARNSDNDTYALHDLKTAAQNKLLWKYMISLGIPDEKIAKQNLYYYYNGRCTSLSNMTVFHCREKLQPSKWYYKKDEQLPEKIEFIPKHNVKELLYTESLGHLKLFEMVKELSIPIFAEKYDTSINLLKNMIYKRQNKLNEKMCFKSLPNEKFIIKMRDIINPDLWYIFPDEI